jgi:hypothetical protein
MLNIMDYSYTRFTLYHWQWEVIHYLYAVAEGKAGKLPG